MIARCGSALWWVPAATLVMLISGCGRKAAPPPTQPKAAKQPSQTDQLAMGKALYANYCLACHGEAGDGKGTAAVYLYPKPRDFRGVKFRLVTTENRIPSDEDLRRAISRGMPGSAMFPFEHLGETQVDALVAYVRHLTRQGIEERLRKAAALVGEDIDPAQLARDVDRLAKPSKPIALPGDFPEPNPESIARGKKIYMEQCATCHGETGKGDGVEEQFDEDGTPTRPRDFTRGIFKGGSEPYQLYARIAIGMPGTPMPGSPHLQPAQIGDLVNFTRSLSDPAAQAKVEHKRRRIVAKRINASLTESVSDAVWADAEPVSIVVSPLWWRNYPEPDLKVQAVHDGKILALRMSWNDATVNDSAFRPEDFEDMAAVELFQGEQEPFLGMGTAEHAIDLWLWRAGWKRQMAKIPSLLDDYPFDTPVYARLTKGKGKATPDFLTARAAGNPNTNADRSLTASSLVAKGFGSTTFRPKASQLVQASAEHRNGRWIVILRRPLTVPEDGGLSFAAGQRTSIAFAIWDGAFRDRNGQKLVSIWHDLELEQ